MKPNSTESAVLSPTVSTNVRIVDNTKLQLKPVLGSVYRHKSNGELYMIIRIYVFSEFRYALINLKNGLEYGKAVEFLSNVFQGNENFFELVSDVTITVNK